jgi:hypothetical protein
MTTAFDGSASGYAHDTLPEPTTDFAGLDTLSLLKQTVDERVDIEKHTVTVPGGRVRLVCRIDISDRDLRRWQRASLPPALRKGRDAANATPLDQNQLVIAVAVLVNTTMQIDVLGKDNKTWITVEHNGDSLNLAHDAVLTAFGAIDTTTALIKIFGRESDVIRASQDVLAAAGWTGENGDTASDEDDPQ